ncbi:hypothetical protein RKLH11_493 [Rhodobacteraceae bacterium KLH11]|nr:hypothetical protein RKLH11_493 [Rhodobacteraceae bacterium KLH11]
MDIGLEIRDEAEVIKFRLRTGARLTIKELAARIDYQAAYLQRHALGHGIPGPIEPQLAMRRLQNPN